MWQPREEQLLVIWIAVFVGLLFAIVFATGLVGFCVPVLIGALLVWLLQGKSEKARD